MLLIKAIWMFSIIIKIKNKILLFQNMWNEDGSCNAYSVAYVEKPASLAFCFPGQFLD